MSGQWPVSLSAHTSQARHQGLRPNQPTGVSFRSERYSILVWYTVLTLWYTIPVWSPFRSGAPLSSRFLVSIKCTRWGLTRLPSAEDRRVPCAAPDPTAAAWRGEACMSLHGRSLHVPCRWRPWQGAWCKKHKESIYRLERQGVNHQRVSSNTGIDVIYNIALSVSDKHYSDLLYPRRRICAAFARPRRSNGGAHPSVLCSPRT